MGFLKRLFGGKGPTLTPGQTDTSSNSEEQYWSSIGHMNQHLSQLDIPGALKNCDDALTASPGDTLALQSKVELLIANNQFDEALRLLDLHFSDESHSPFRFTCLSWIALQRH